MFLLFPQLVQFFLACLVLFCSANRHEEHLISLLKRGRYHFREILPHLEFKRVQEIINSTLEESRCHLALHSLGQQLFQHFPNRTLEQTLSECYSFCTKGCFHGVSQGFSDMKSVGRHGGHQKICCEPFENDRDVFDCWHGIGHHLEEKFGVGMGEALCQNSSDIDLAQRLCLTGFREKKHLLSTEVMKLCVDSPYSSQCYFFGIHGVTEASDATDLETFTRARSEWVKTCNSLPTQEQTACFFGLGGILYYAHLDERIIAAVCNLEPVWKHYACFIGSFQNKNDRNLCHFLHSKGPIMLVALAANLTVPSLQALSMAAEIENYAFTGINNSEGRKRICL